MLRKNPKQTCDKALRQPLRVGLEAAPWDGEDGRAKLRVANPPCCCRPDSAQGLYVATLYS